MANTHYHFSHSSLRNTLKNL